MNTSGKDSPRATVPAGFIRRRPVAALIIALVLAEALAVAVALRLGLFEDTGPEVYYPPAEKILPPPAVPPAVLASEKMIGVRTDRGVETVAIVFALADQYRAYHNLTTRNRQPFRKAAYKHFKEFSGHEAVEIGRTLLKRGFWMDAMLRIPLVCTRFPEARIVIEPDPGFYTRAAGPGDSPDREAGGREIVARFIAALNRFYIDAGVERYLAANDTHYTVAREEVGRNLPDGQFIPVMEYYYGNRNLAYTIIPSPLIHTQWGFGPRLRTEEGLMAFNIIGPRKRPPDDIADGCGFDDPGSIREICVHEFGHSFVNPLTSRYSGLLERYSRLFGPVEGEMRRQGYPGWWTCATEHIVRLGEVRIAMLLGEKERADRLRKNYVESRKFIYLPALEERVIEYEQHRDRYQSFEDFFPELLGAFAMLDSLYAGK